MFLPIHFCCPFFTNMQERFMLAVGNISNQRRPSCAVTGWDSFALWKGPLEGRPVNTVVGLQPPWLEKNKNTSGTPSGFVVGLGFSVIFPVAPSTFLFVWGLSPLLTCREPYKGFPFSRRVIGPGLVHRSRPKSMAADPIANGISLKWINKSCRNLNPKGSCLRRAGMGKKAS